MNYPTGTLLLLTLAALLVAGAVLPVQVLYASSGSMEPTIREGDLYIVRGSSDVEEGDVIAFESSRYEQIVTHRVVDRTPDGFVTKGDANPSTDQAGGHPPVRDSQVIGEVVEVAGTPVTVPGIGPAIDLLQTYRWLALLAIAAFLFGPELLNIGRSHERPRRSVLTAGAILHPMFALAVVTCFLLLFWGASVHAVTFVATAGQATAAHAVPVGEAVIKTVTVETYVPPLTTVIVDAHGMEVLERSVAGSTIDLTVRLPAKETIGPYDTRLTVNAYPATLPHGVLETLDAIHWTVAATASLTPIFLPIFAIYLLAADPRAPLRWPRSRWLRSLGGN